MRNISFRSIEAARTIAETGQTGSRINLPNGLEIRLDYTDLVISRGPVDLTSHYPQVAAKPSLYLAIPGSVDLAQGWRLTADRRRAMDLELIRQNRDPWQCFIAIPSDCELMVRSRQPGERIQPLGMESGTKIKEVMINRKIPASARNRWPIIATHSHPVWIVGHVLDERARVHDDNEWIVHLRCFREVNDSAEL
jgi:tRNA(Ile)-lysidine synthase